MSERKYRTRPPVRELDLAFNPDQPRDSHGRWTSRPGSEAPSVEQTRQLFNRAFAARVAPKPAPQWTDQPEVKQALGQIHHGEERAFRVMRARKIVTESKVLLSPKGKFKDEPAAYRHFRKITEEAQLAVFHEAGLKLEFEQHSTTELMKMWEEPGHSFEEREKFRREVQARMKQLDIVAKAMDQSMTDFVRENRRDALRKFDAKLRTLPGGHAVIALREKMTTDKVLDHVEAIREHFHEHGKEYAKHVITTVAIASLLHPLGIAAAGGLAAAHFAPAGAPEVLSHLLENMYVHAGLSVALSGPVLKFLDPIFRPLEKESRVRSAKKFRQKHQNRRLHV